MVITRTQGTILLVTVAGLATIARTGLLVDLLLLMTAGLMLIPLVSRPRLAGRLRWVLAAFGLLFSLYLMLTVLDPSRTGIVNVIGIAITGIVFFYFAQNAERLVAAPGTARLLLASGVIIALAGVGLDAVKKNTISGIAAYFFLSAGVVWVARGVHLRRVALWMFLLLSALGLLLGHRLMAGAALLLWLVIFVMYSVPLRMVRTLILGSLVAGIFGMIVLYAGLWGFDIRDLDAFFIEYTGRTARSGRQIIWPVIIAFVSQSPWFGLGTDATFSSLYDSKWSAHSYFLQIYLQSGIVGIGCLLALLGSIWAAIGRPRRSQPVGVYVTACFAVLLIHISFEVFLMQVNLLMGCCAWMMLGLGVGCIRGAESPALRPAPIYDPPMARMTHQF